jgi:hypothetical protein
LFGTVTNKQIAIFARNATNMYSMNSKKFWFITASIVLVALTRFLPHPPNFTAVGAMALFGGALYQSNILRYGLPLLILFLTDLVLNNVVYAAYYDGFTLFTSGAFYLYGATLGMVALGQVLIKVIKVKNVALASVAGSTLFFLVTNLGVWASGTMYPLTPGGLILCYEAGLPFFLNTLASGLLFSLYYSGLIT